MAINPGSQKQPVKKSIRPGMLAMGICLMSGDNLYADNWGFEPSLKQDLSWDSNPLLLTGSHPTLFGSITTPQLTITDNSPTTLLGAVAALDENIFNQSDFDSTDLHAKIDLDKKLQQWEAGFIEQTDYDTTRTSEITTFNTNTVGSVRHFGNSLAPEISFSPTAIDKISLGGSILTSQYDNNLFTDYHIISLGPSYQYNYNPLNTAIISVQAQRYQTDASLNSTVDSIAPTLGWTAILTPTWTAKATMGAEEYRQEGNAIPSQQWKWTDVFSANLSHKGLQDNLSLDVSRALQPYANGTEFFLNTISLTDTHTLNPLFSAHINASYQFTGNSDEASTNLKSLISANAGITYHATTKVDVMASYQYREQTLTSIAGNQNDAIFILSLVYRPILPIVNGNK